MIKNLHEPKLHYVKAFLNTAAFFLSLLSVSFSLAGLRPHDKRWLNINEVSSLSGLQQLL